MKARDVMTHCVVSIGPQAPIVEAIARMISHQVSGMPVIDATGRLVGVVSESDFLRRAEMRTEAPRRRWLELLAGPGAGADEYAHSHGRTVRDVMSQTVISIAADAPLSEAVSLMEEHGIRRLPVVDDGRVVGIVSRADLMSALAQYLMRAEQAPTADETIRAAIVTRMKTQTWCPLNQVSVVVRKGMVELKGMIFDERQRRALQVLVETVPGVVTVQDQLVLVEPMSAAVIGAERQKAAVGWGSART